MGNDSNGRAKAGLACQRSQPLELFIQDLEKNPEKHLDFINELEWHPAVYEYYGSWSLLGYDRQSVDVYLISFQNLNAEANIGTALLQAELMMDAPKMVEVVFDGTDPSMPQRSTEERRFEPTLLVDCVGPWKKKPYEQRKAYVKEIFENLMDWECFDLSDEVLLRLDGGILEHGLSDGEAEKLAQMIAPFEGAEFIETFKAEPHSGWSASFVGVKDNKVIRIDAEYLYD